MNLKQKRIRNWLILFGLVYFLIWAIPNARGAESERMLLATSQDEPVTYPHVVRMLTPASDFKDLFSRWVLYGDYHYGYPFYFFSALVLLPVRLFMGGEFVKYTGLNLLLLRQFISVLPMLIAILLLINEQTSFRSSWQTFGLAALMSIVPAFVRNNIQWWHPDALSVLSVTLVLIFLSRDNFRFGKYFFLAAVACGVSLGIKFAGVFFVQAIPYYLLMGYLQKRLSIKQALGKAALFIVTATLALVVSNPFLYNAGARQELARIQTEKVEVLRKGYEDSSPYYQRGPKFWEWTLSNWYGHPLFLIFLGSSLLVGCLWGENRWLNRLILAYILPQSIYLLWFVAVKPDHYWLPVMVPLFSASLTIPRAFVEGWFPRIPVRVRRWMWAGLIILLILQALVFLFKPYSGVVVQFQNGLKIESMFSK